MQYTTQLLETITAQFSKGENPVQGYEVVGSWRDQS
jgi:hypothetical protein